MTAGSITPSEVRIIQAGLVRSAQKLASLRQRAVDDNDLAKTQLIDQLMENGQTYSVFLEDYLRQAHPKDAPKTRRMIDKIGEHCWLVNAAFAKDSTPSADIRT